MHEVVDDPVDPVHLFVDAAFEEVRGHPHTAKGGDYLWVIVDHEVGLEGLSQLFQPLVKVMGGLLVDPAD